MFAKENNQESNQVTVLFVAVDMVGHLNLLIAVTEQLVATGHRAIFALERSWAGQIADHYAGIEEVLFTDPMRDPALKPNQFWVENTKLLMGNFHLEGVEKVVAAFSSSDGFKMLLLHALLPVDDQLVEIIESRVKPDVIVVDAFKTVPAVWHSGRPWGRAFSAAPLSFVRSSDLPPPGSGIFNFRFCNQ